MIESAESSPALFRRLYLYWHSANDFNPAMVLTGLKHCDD